ncbi:protein PEAK3 [Lissotriton helveticus]
MDTEASWSHEARSGQPLTIDEESPTAADEAGNRLPCAKAGSSQHPASVTGDGYSLVVPSKGSRGLPPSLCSTGTCSPHHQQKPPPLPPKQLIRTLSLPIVKPCCHQMWTTPYPGASFSNQHHTGIAGGHNPPSSPRCREKASLGRNPRISKSQSLHKDARTSSPDTTVDLESLSFTSADEELSTFFKDLTNGQEVHDKLIMHHRTSLCHFTTRLQEMLTSADGKLKTALAWEDYRFLDSGPCCEAGDAWYYLVCLATDSRNILAAKVHKFEDKSEVSLPEPVGLSLQKTISPHFNIQEVSDCFSGDFSVETLLPNDQNGFGRDIHWPISNKPLCHAQIALTPQVPCKTLAGFLVEYQEVHVLEPDDYERLACLLLLQLCNGLEHLKLQGITHCDLCPENLLIVEDAAIKRGPNNLHGKNTLPRLVISNFSKAKRTAQSIYPTNNASSSEQARLAPELLSNIQYKKVDEFQLGILIYEILHQENPFQDSSRLLGEDYSTADLPAIPNFSCYSQGLQRLAALLLHADPRGRMSVAQAKTILEVLLWGPSRDLFRQHTLGPVLLQNWIEVKQALLIMRFAEKSIDGEVARTIEEWLCCQYFTQTTDHALLYAARILYVL